MLQFLLVMMPEFHKFFPMYQRNFMDLELVVEKRDGFVRVMCPGIPHCVAEGGTVKEAVERIADKIARSVSLRIRREVREQILAMSAQLPENMPPIPVAGMFGLSIGKFPVSLN